MNSIVIFCKSTHSNDTLNFEKSCLIHECFVFVFFFYSIVVQGVIDLFRLPYEQYQRDGRIVRGIQLGAQSFTSRTALAALELTTRLIYLLQVMSIPSFDVIIIIWMPVC